METTIMTFVNVDGKLIEKEVENTLVSIYKSMGWKIKENNKTEKFEKIDKIDKNEKVDKEEKKFDSFKL